jgi:hypothetical protein
MKIFLCQEVEGNYQKWDSFVVAGELGRRFEICKGIDINAGFAERPLTKEEIMERFRNCMSYAKKPLSDERVEKLLSLIGKLEEVEDIRGLIPLALW